MNGAKKGSNFMKNSVTKMTALVSVVLAATASGTAVGADCEAVRNAHRLGYSSQLRDDTVSVIDLETHELVNTLKGFHYPFNTEVSPDGAKLYVDNAGSVIGKSNNVEIRDLCTGATIKKIPVKLPPFSARSTDGHYILSTAPDGTVLRTDTVTNEVRTYDVAFGAAHAVSVDGKVIWISTFFGSLYTIDGDTGLIFGSKAKVGGVPAVVALSPDGSKVVTFDLTGHGISIVDTDTRKVTRVVVPGSTPAFGKISPDSRYIWFGDYANFVRVYDLEKSQIVKTIDTGGFAVGVNFWKDRALVSTTDVGTTKSGKGFSALFSALRNRWTPGGRVWVIDSKPPFDKIDEYASHGNEPMVVSLPMTVGATLGKDDGARP
jgi:DNA-binding beta-propeller fold protein YncE